MIYAHARVYKYTHVPSRAKRSASYTFIRKWVGRSFARRIIAIIICVRINSSKCNACVCVCTRKSNAGIVPSSFLSAFTTNGRLIGTGVIGTACPPVCPDSWGKNVVGKKTRRFAVKFYAKNLLSTAVRFVIGLYVVGHHVSVLISNVFINRGRTGSFFFTLIIFFHSIYFFFHLLW